jgi:hypothetical protein
MMQHQHAVDMNAPRREAVNAAKAAVHAYARDPSKANAIAVDVAWRRVRALDSVMPWRNEQVAAIGPRVDQHPG